MQHTALPCSMRLVGYDDNLHDLNVASHNLRTSMGWGQNKSVALCWDRHWENCYEQWAACFRQASDAMSSFAQPSTYAISYG